MSNWKKVHTGDPRITKYTYVDKRSEKQFEGPGEGDDWSWTSESQDAMSEYLAKQDKMAKETEQKQGKKPPF